MEWVPIVLITFKVGVLGTAMFFSIKWHYDQDKKKKEREKSEASAAPAPIEQSPGAPD